MRLIFDFRNDRYGGTPARRVYAHPLEVVTANRVDDVLPTLAAVERAVAGGRHAAGYIAYEAAPAFEPAYRVRGGNRMPLLWFGIFEAPRVTASPAAIGSSGGDDHQTAWVLETPRARYDAAIAAIRYALAEGRTYQVNYTSRLRAPWRPDPGPLYERLRRAQGPGFHAWLDLGRFHILSASPELFFRRRGDDIAARPMKGTRERGRWTGEDDAAARALAASEKDRAENLMIVDLLRNDLGRIARTVTVRVPELFTIERYRTVFQMTSTVTARVDRRLGLTDVLRALFPCGSVTGAPKISTMDVIARLEDSPREVYCGAIGYLEPGGDCAFNVPIRTVWLDSERGDAEYGIGGGVTWDSTARAELEELLAKAAVLREHWPPFQLIETLRMENGRVARLERHLARLRDSAAFFDFRYDEDAVRAALAALARAQPAERRRVRLLLSERGTVQLSSGPLPDDNATEPRPVVLAGPAASVNSRRNTQAWPYHKTTHRAAYDDLRARHPEAFDVLLCNERGEVTEFTRGNVVVQLAGERVTPPREAGLLAGCFRGELLEAKLIAERTIRVSDLDRAEAMWLINSVREWVPVGLLPAAVASAAAPVTASRLARPAAALAAGTRSRPRPAVTNPLP